MQRYKMVIISVIKKQHPFYYVIEMRVGNLSFVIDTDLPDGQGSQPKSGGCGEIRINTQFIS